MTLNKSAKDYSLTTMYNDYSINETLFHWQSQSTTSSESNTGRRYRSHKESEVHELIFVREFKNIESSTSPYTFLGATDFVSYKGSKPMNIIWRLKNPIHAKYLKKTNKLMV